MNGRNTLYLEKLVPILITGGFFAHLINVARHQEFGEGRIGDVLLWPVDFVLTTLMIYSAVGLVLRWRAFSTAFYIDTLTRRIGYWAITFYVAASVPGHVAFLAFGITTYFDIFPWWFSLVIMPVYLLMIVYFLTLRPRPAGISAAP